MKAAVCLDDWKLPFFKKVLDREAFKYTKHPGVTRCTVTLKVIADSVEQLQPFVREANDAAARSTLN